MTKVSPVRDRARVIDVIKAAFVQGTTELGYENNDLIAPCPDSPPDLFGVCALLLNSSGAYSGMCVGDCIFDDQPHSYGIAESSLDKAKFAGRVWAQKAIVPNQLQDWWAELIEFSGEPLITPGKKLLAGPPQWWEICHRLFIAADEASYGVGLYGYSHSMNKRSDVSWVDRIVRNSDPHLEIDGNNVRLLTKRSTTIASRLNTDLGCVQPKIHTPSVGCTLRTLSRNLAFLPHRGQINTNWFRASTSDFGDSKQAGFNILLIPLPYSIDPRDFIVGVHESQNVTKSAHWGWFELEQSWLPSTKRKIADFLRYIKSLVQKSISENGPVHGIVFPEYALNWDIFEKITEMIANDFTEIELLISGSSENCQRQKGNFVISSTFYNVRDHDKSLDDEGAVVRDYSVHSRPKHHRWKMDDWQAKRYGMEEVFKHPPNVKFDGWWEKIPIPPRELHFSVFRERGVFTTLICEDLARSDPCHSVLRSVGPNLIFVLLMDGPQLPQRWSARYSTGLSDDPGSSVLTFTSLALVKASNENGPKEQESWTVALWKDDQSNPQPIEMNPEHAQAVTLRLRVEDSKEFTFDGRVSNRSHRWRIAQGKASGVDISDEKPSLVSQFGPSCT